MRRRTLLAGIGGLVGIGGCLAAGEPGSCGLSGGPPNSVHLINTDSTDRTVELTVYLDVLVHRDVVYEDVVELASRTEDDGTHVVLPDVVTRAGRHVLRVRVRGTGATTDHLWDVTTTGCNALVVSIEDGQASVSLLSPDGPGSGGPQS